MKNYFVISAIFCFGLIVSSCSSSSDKVEDAKEDVRDANKELVDANIDYLVDMETYKRETAEKIAANDLIIKDFNKRVDTQRSEAKKEYQNKIAELEVKNTDLKKKLDSYNLEGKESWDKLKSDFNQELNDLALAVQKFTEEKGNE
jgi:hypothetical protein